MFYLVPGIWEWDVPTGPVTHDSASKVPSSTSCLAIADLGASLIPVSWASVDVQPHGVDLRVEFRELPRFLATIARTSTPYLHAIAALMPTAGLRSEDNRGSAVPASPARVGVWEIRDDY